MTISDWDITKNSQNYHTNIAAVCKRLKSLGLREVCLNSLSRVLWAISCGYKNMPDQSVMYQEVQDIKLGFASIPVPTIGLSIVVKYPDDPTKLSSQLYAQCCSNEHPAQITPDKTPMILKPAALRHTHVSIAKAKTMLTAPSAGSSGAPSFSSSGTVSQILTFGGVQTVKCSLVASRKPLAQPTSARKSLSHPERHCCF